MGERVRIAVSVASDQLAASHDAMDGNFLIAFIQRYLLLIAIFSTGSTYC